MSFEDFQGGFVIDDIEEEASVPEQSMEREKITVPAGTGYNVRSGRLILQRLSKRSGFWRATMVLELIDGPYAGGALYINLWHNNGSTQKGKQRDAMAKREVAQIAKAVGVVGRLDNISDQLAGKTLTCDYIKKQKGVNAKNFRPLGSLKSEPAPKPKPQTEGPTEPSDEIPF